MSDWGTQPDPASAGEGANDFGLVDATNNVRLVDPANPRDAAAAKEAADKGWVPPVPTSDPLAQLKATDAAATEMVNRFAEQNPALAHAAAKYEWQDDFGEVGPVNKALEEELFGSELRVREGVNIDGLLNIKVVVEGVDKPNPVRSFHDVGFHPVLEENINLCQFEAPTPVQCYSIPAIMTGRDIVCISQTGSGKTLAFLAPALSKLMGKAKKLRAPRGKLGLGGRAEPLLLVVVPTRELCIQIFDEARRLCYRSMLRPCVAYGGGPSREQRDDLRKGCDILIATPGRLIDFLRDPSLLSLNRVRYTVLDEADEMLHDDWQEELSQIMTHSTQDSQHQFCLFSATFAPSLRKLAKKYLGQDYLRIRVGRIGSTLPHIKQQIFFIDGNRKMEALYDLILAGKPCRTMIFVKSKKMVDIVDDFLFHKGLPVTSLHSDRSQIEREDSMRSFRSGKCPIMVTTGVAARGIDVSNILHVIQYDLPSVDFGGADEYIHRIGRTGRLGNLGLATSFYNDADEPLAPFLAKILTENGQEVPDFLESYKPVDGEELDFNDQSEDEEEETHTATNGTDGNEVVDAWGGETDTPAVVEPAIEAWGQGQNTAGNSNGDTW